MNEKDFISRKNYNLFSKYIKSLNEIILNGTKEEQIEAIAARDRLLKPADNIKDVVLIRKSKRKYPVMYTYISKKNNKIDDNDMCVIYKIGNFK